eukprot:GHVQ01030043.1.p1 GENE.GHVQ01030043.1~~GHVQ01030043.1.p1  ORF type:complete len:277 (-),score=16.07 GHVQ01030043.1:410-1240(-)
MLRLSRLKLKPNRSLCMPTKNAESDGPYRTIRFKLRTIRRDFQNVLIHGDVKKLTSTAEELLRNPTVRKSPSFWDIFAKRTILSAGSLTPVDMAFILKSFDEHKQIGGVYSIIGSRLMTKTRQTNGIAMVTLLEILCRRLKKNYYPELFNVLTQQLPNIMYELPPADLIKILHSLHVAREYNEKTCKVFERKLMAQMDEISAQDIANLSILLSLHGYRCPLLYQRIQECSLRKVQDFSAFTMHRLLWGLENADQDCDVLLVTLDTNSPEIPSQMTR